MFLNLLKMYWNHRTQKDPKNFIFGFGSIVNDESRKSTDPDSGDPIPVRISEQFGYKRVWNFQSPTASLTALGLMKVINGQQPATINGIIYPISGNDMSAFDEREEGYSRVEIPLDMIQAVGWKNLPSHETKIWLYIPNGENNVAGVDLIPANKYYPILQTYIDVVLLGFLKYGEDFAIEFLYTTGWWSKYWLNDRQVPRRPWLYQGKYKTIDNLLSRYSEQYGLDDVDNTKVDLYQGRKLPVEFGIFFAEEIGDVVHDGSGHDSSGHDSSGHCLPRYHPETISEIQYKCVIDPN